MIERRLCGGVRFEIAGRPTVELCHATDAARPCFSLRALVGCMREDSAFSGRRDYSEVRIPAAISLLLIAHPSAADAARRYPIQSRKPRGLRCTPEYSMTIRAFDPKDTSWWRRNRRGSRSVTRCLNWIELPSPPFEIAYRRHNEGFAI